MPLEDKWHLSEDANEFMIELAENAGDDDLKRMLLDYGKNPTVRNAKRLAKIFRLKKHRKVVMMLMEYIKKAASVYPDRKFNKNVEENKSLLMKKAFERKKELEDNKREAVVYREEPFVYDCDGVEFNVYIMIWKNGIRNSRVEIEKIEL